jgi:MarR family transcriptional regulator, 2-MHQ and catechol-resistance regulon repressor
MTKRRLQQELKKKQPFKSLEQEAMLNILRTSDQFQNRIGRLFREYGLTSSQYNILRILRGEGRPMPCLEIANRMIQVVPAITGLIDRLEQAGMVRRQRSESDRRVIKIEITPKALATLAELDAPEMELQKQLLGHLTRTELAELSRLLEKARVSLTEGN